MLSKAGLNENMITPDAPSEQFTQSFVDWGNKPPRKYIIRTASMVLISTIDFPYDR